MPFGAEFTPTGEVRFRLWAPAASSLDLVLEGREQPLPMNSVGDGWYELLLDRIAPGTAYSFALPDGKRVPDPASRHQQTDVNGASIVVDPAAYVWQNTTWKGLPWNEAVLYELHVGAFTEEGTFRSAIAKLDHLVNLGVTAIEIMPVADFPGDRGWGYDGVLLYAPHGSYGQPEDLKALVDAAHDRGLAVLLDVVYNHFGPEGNYLPSYAPNIFTKHHKTPWGDAVNFDDSGSQVVREFVIHNALYWIEEFNLDGLRLDAVHAIKDDSPRHLLDELAERVRSLAGDRPVHLILENEGNQASRLARDSNGQPTQFTAQWNDDMHHVLHTAATLESNGYYKEYKDDPEKLGKALAEGFAYQGQIMTHSGASRGEPSAFLPPDAFVAFMQNHDQIGNRAFGERINRIASPEAVHAIASIYLLLPQTPMLFMGEEWGSSQPFPYFCDFHGELADLVRKGRRDEFATFPEFRDPEQRDRIPDPLAEETFLSAKLDWEQAKEGVHAEWIDWYKTIIATRRERIRPLLEEIGGHAGTYQVLGNGSVVVRWALGNGGELVLAANLSDNSVDGFPGTAGEILWQQGPGSVEGCMRPWSVSWSLQRP